MQIRTVLVVIALSWFVGPCFHSSKSKITLVSNSSPLAFKVDGDAQVQWIWVRGPFQNEHDPAPEIPEPSDPEKIIVWRIAPAVQNGARRYVPMNKIPPITYGQVPEGWEQVIPESGAPPALLDGYVYRIGVVARGGADLCVLVKNGQIQSYEEQEEGSPCRKTE